MGFTWFSMHKGRIMFDVLAYQLSASGGESGPTYLLEVDANHLNSAIKYLNMFRVKRKVIGIFSNIIWLLSFKLASIQKKKQVEIADVRNQYNLFALMNLSSKEETVTFKRAESFVVCEHDPRSRLLGYRLITKSVDSKIASSLLIIIIFLTR
jgi:hypothetical protein